MPSLHVTPPRIAPSPAIIEPVTMATTSDILIRDAHHMDITCYYREVTPGVEGPAHDIPLGCDYIDFYGNEVTGPDGAPGFSSGVHGGVPLAGSSCDNAGVAIGGGFIPYPGSGSQVYVTSESGVWSYGTNVGWLYMGSDGNQYAQANTAAEPFGMPTASGYLLMEFFGFPALYAPDTSVVKMPAGQHLTHTARPAKCHTAGSNLG